MMDEHWSFGIDFKAVPITTGSLVFVRIPLDVPSEVRGRKLHEAWESMISEECHSFEAGKRWSWGQFVVYSKITLGVEAVHQMYEKINNSQIAVVCAAVDQDFPTTMRLLERMSLGKNGYWSGFMLAKTAKGQKGQPTDSDEEN